MTAKNEYMLTFNRHQHWIGQIIIAAIIIANILWWHQAWLGVIFGLIYIWLNSKKLSDIIFPQIHQGLKNILGLLIILAYISFNYTLAYHLHHLSFWLFVWIFLSIPIIIEFVSWRKKTEHYFLDNIDINQWRPASFMNWLWPTLVILLDVLLTIYLFKKASTGVVRSPWELLTYKFWLVFILSNLALTINIINKKSSKNILLISLHFFLLSSLAIILYPLGYGYDSFIHAATLNILEKTGTIEPRLFLYVGQYGLSFFIHYLWQISLASANKILLPLLFALLWPTSLYYGLRHGLHWSCRASYLSALWSLFIGFNFAIMTTPQSLVYLLVAVVIFLLPEIQKKNISLYLVWILAIMATTIHPIGGLALLYLAVIISLQGLPIKRLFKNLLLYFTYLVSALSLPIFLAYYQILNNIPSQNILKFSWPHLSWPNLHWQQTYSFPLDLLHNIGQNQNYLYIILVLIGLLLISKNHKLLFFKKNLIFSCLLLANYLLAKIFINFNLQIAYQKDDYPNRLLYLLALSVLPIFLTSIYYLFQNALKKRPNVFQGLFITAVTIAIISISTYFSYPVYDQHKNSKSFSVTASDLKTVNTIETDAQGQPYIVLANQMVGAAAINQFGFAHYYNENFYYSMPLGLNNIYQEFLQMINTEANRNTALSAMDKADVNTLYFVVNNYWHSAKRAIREAQMSSDRYFSIDNGMTYVFVYKR